MPEAANRKASPRNKKPRLLRRGDIIFFAVVLLCAAGIAVIPLFRREGATLRVEQNGELVGEYSLRTDRVIELPGGENTAVIENGRVRMTYADCPDQICVSHIPISYEGETIVCLPNRVVLCITGAAAGGYDALAG